MEFENYYGLLESFAEKKLAERESAMATTDELAELLGIGRKEAVGAYEAYNRSGSNSFRYEREFDTDYEAYKWNVTIKKV